MESESAYDVVVVGGGPAGSTLATLVTKRGGRVLLLERERFPRHQIGESLLPATIHGVCRLLDVFDDVEQAGFVRKRGGTFRWGRNDEPWTFDFGKASVNKALNFTYAYQVERSRFDHILLQNARRHGVEVHEEATVGALVEEAGRVCGVRWVESGQERVARARYVVDAAGHQSRFHQRAGKREYSKFFQNVALYCYYENAGRLPAPNSGNIFSVAFDEGWFWYIPLSDSLTSVGAVVAKEHADRLRGDPEAAMRSFVDKCPRIASLLSSGTRVSSGPYGSYRIRKDYSYTNTAFWAPGLVLIGDAACFIDPVFSSGVHLATYSGLLAARSILTCMQGRLDENESFGEFERRYRQEFAVFYEFLLGFYDMHQDEESYFWKARKVLRSDDRDNSAFIQLVAGMGTTADDFFGLRGESGEMLQLLVDAVADPVEGGKRRQERLASLPADARQLAERAASAPNEAGRGIIAQALPERFGAVREALSAPEPTTAHIVPSRDGLYWERRQPETTQLTSS